MPSYEASYELFELAQCNFLLEQIKEMFSRIERVGNHMAHPTERATGQAPLRAIIIDARNLFEMDPR